MAASTALQHCLLYFSYQDKWLYPAHSAPIPTLFQLKFSQCFFSFLWKRRDSGAASGAIPDTWNKLAYILFPVLPLKHPRNFSYIAHLLDYTNNINYTVAERKSY